MAEAPISQEIIQEPHPAQPSAEIALRGRALRRYVDRIVALRPPSEESIDTYNDLSAREKADVLYEKFTAYHGAVATIRQEQKEHPDTEPDPVDPYLVGEIATLWQDPAVQDTFLQTFSQARVEAKAYRLSELGKNWHGINGRIDTSRAAFEHETRKLFLHEVSRSDHVSATQGRAKRLAKELIDLQAKRESIVTLKGLSPTPENTDIAAQITYEELGKYYEQLANGGFVWLPSRLELHTKTLEALQNGRWPVLIGEAGTGKSEQAVAAAVVLTGEQPTLQRCDSRTNEQDLVARQEIGSETEGSYYTYGPVMQAATGFTDSRQDAPQVRTGRIVRLDESGRLGSNGYAILKELRQKRTATPQDIERFKRGEPIDVGKLLQGKPVLPGFASIWTTNPVGARYPDRTEPDAAMRREVAGIDVDYSPMSSNDPELYEFMLAALMDQNKHIPVAERELAPAYTPVTYDESKQEVLPDGRHAIGTDMLVEDPTSIQHGSLYRLSFAVRQAQNAFIYGNKQPSSIPQDALRYTIDNDGKIQITQTGGETLTLSTSTITLGEVKSWMTGFHERMLKDDPAFHTKTLSEWIQLKAKTYLNQVDADDKEKVQAIFEHYNLFSPAPDLTNEKPITPKRIGYLSPRVPRPLHVIEPVVESKEDLVKPETQEEKNPQPEMYQDKQIMLEDGSTLIVSPQSIQINMREES